MKSRRFFFFSFASTATRNCLVGCWFYLPELLWRRVKLQSRLGSAGIPRNP
jgi:hypothetical protein